METINSVFANFCSVELGMKGLNKFKLSFIYVEILLIIFYIKIFCQRKIDAELNLATVNATVRTSIECLF